MLSCPRGKKYSGIKCSTCGIFQNTLEQSTGAQCQLLAFTNVLSYHVLQVNTVRKPLSPSDKLLFHSVQGTRTLLQHPLCLLEDAQQADHQEGKVGDAERTAGWVPCAGRCWWPRAAPRPEQPAACGQAGAGRDWQGLALPTQQVCTSHSQLVKAFLQVSSSCFP